MRKAVLGVALPLMLLGGCELKVGKDDAKNTASIQVGDDGNVAIAAADGADGVAISVPGFDAKVKIPGMELGGDHMDIGGMKLYPGSKLSGINVTDRQGAGNGQVDMRFTSPGKVDAVADYYAAAARDSQFTAINLAKAGGKATLTANNPEGDAMTIMMEPAAEGTAGRIVVKDSGK